MLELIYLLVCCADGKTETRPRHTLIGHSEKINAIVQSKGVLGKLYTASSDNTVIGSTTTTTYPY